MSDTRHIAALQSQLARVRAETIEECARVADDRAERALEAMESCPESADYHREALGTAAFLAVAIRALGADNAGE